MNPDLEIKRYPDLELEGGKLSKEAAIQAGEVVRAFVESPAWFRLSQFLHKDKSRCQDILEADAHRKSISEFATESGKIKQIRQFEKHLVKILEEAQAARES